MPENARTPLVWGVLLSLLALPFGMGGLGVVGFLLRALGAVLLAVGVIAWGVWLAIDQWERDRLEAERSRRRPAPSGATTPRSWWDDAGEPPTSAGQ